MYVVVFYATRKARLAFGILIEWPLFYFFLSKKKWFEFEKLCCAILLQDSAKNDSFFNTTTFLLYIANYRRVEPKPRIYYTRWLCVL